MTNRIQAWQCIGCGKIDAPQPCIGVCQDRKVELAGADDYDRALARIGELEGVLCMLARATPRDGEWGSAATGGCRSAPAGYWPVNCSHNVCMRRSTAGSGTIVRPQLRCVSPGHLAVASKPSLEPRPGSGLAKSR